MSTAEQTKTEAAPARQKRKPGTEIVAFKSPAERAVIALDATKTEADLRELVSQSVTILAVIDPDGREQAHRAGMTLKNARVAIKKIGKAAREDAQAFSQAVIAEENRLVEIVTGEEDRIFGLRDAYDVEQARLKREAEEREAARVAAIKEKIAIVAEMPGRLANASSTIIHAKMAELAGMDCVTGYDEFAAQMRATVDTVGSALLALRGAAREREEVEAKRLREQEEERQRLAAQAEENRRQAAELETKRQEAVAAAKAIEAEHKRLAAEVERVRKEAEEGARMAAEAIAREREAMERERAELAAMRAAMAPKAEPVKAPVVETATELPKPVMIAQEKRVIDDSASEKILRAAVRGLRETRTSAEVVQLVRDELGSIDRGR